MVVGEREMQTELFQHLRSIKVRFDQLALSSISTPECWLKSANAPDMLVCLITLKEVNQFQQKRVQRERCRLDIHD